MEASHAAWFFQRLPRKSRKEDESSKDAHLALMPLAFGGGKRGCLQVELSGKCTRMDGLDGQQLRAPSSTDTWGGTRSL